jgi:hypothetical protein
MPKRCSADLIMKNSVKFFPIEENNHPYVTKGEKQAKVVREEIRFMFTSLPFARILFLITLKA